jgi:ribonuclease T1
VLALVTWALNQGGFSGGGRAGDADPGTMATVRVAALPVEARDTLALIDRGGPFPYDRDDVVFENREGLLPDEDTGYYHEYTVPTPGSSDRGARRIIVGSAGEYYWTDDHYQSFRRILR